jgi:hypothetical protein
MLKDWAMLGGGGGGGWDGRSGQLQSSRLSIPVNIAQGDTSISPPVGFCIANNLQKSTGCLILIRCQK